MGNNSSWHSIVSKNGYNIAEVASALQKSIRRSMVPEALYWVSELYNSGYEAYAWKRLLIILNEDMVAEENPGLAADVWALYQMAMEYKKLAKKDQPAEVQTLALAQAVVRLCGANKNRWVCHAMIYYFRMPVKNGSQRAEIPEYALDRHTIRGKQKNRGWDFFFEEASKLINPDGSEVEPDPFQKAVWEWLKDGSPSPQKGPADPNPPISGGSLFE